MNDEYFELIDEPEFISFDELDKALKIQSELDDEESAETIVNFILREFWDKKKNYFTEKELNDRFDNLLISFILDNMVELGEVSVFIDENGEEVYDFIKEK